MRLTQLQYLVEIKKQGSITKAAQHLFIAQPSMSTAIRELEEELGFELMKRSKRGVTFTNLGEQAVEKAETILREVEALRCLDEVQTGHMRGRILLSAVPFVCEYFILDLIVQLQTECPDLHLILEENDGYTVLRQVSLMEADLGVTMLFSNEEERAKQALEKNNLEFVEVFRDELYFLVGAQNPYFNEKSVRMEEILQFPYVYYKDSFTDEDRALFSKHCDLHKLETVRMKDQASIKKYVLHSQATTAIPHHAGQGNIYLQTGLLHPLRLSNETWTCRAGLVYRRDRQLSREERFLLEQMQQLSKTIEKL